MSDTGEGDKTLREDLGAVWDQFAEAVADPSKETKEEATGETAEESTEGAAEETIEETTEEATEDTTEEATEETTEEATEDVTEEDPEPEPLEHWHREDKEAFANLDRAGKEFLIRRDKEFQSSVTRKQMDVADIKRALEPVREQLDERGISDGDAVARLIGAHLRLVKDPKNTMLELMDQYGIDASVILGTEGDEDSGSTDSAATRKIQELERRLEQYEKQTLATQADTINRQIAEFKASHEFFDDVEGEMAMIAGSYRNRGEAPPSLAEMYDKACWSVKSVRDKMLLKEKEEKQKAASAKDKKGLSKSRKAAKASVKPASMKAKSDGEKKQKKTLREDLSEVFDELNAR